MITITNPPAGSLAAHILRDKTAKRNQVPDFYIFENGTNNGQGGRPVGAAFAHSKGKGYTVLIAGKRYAAFPPKQKAAVQPEATEGKGA